MVKHQFTMLKLLYASVAVSTLLFVAKQAIESRGDSETKRQSSEMVRLIEGFGGSVYGRQATIPAIFFMNGAHFRRIPQSIREIEIVGTVDSSHTLSCLPMHLEKIKLTISAESVARIPQLDSIRYLDMAVTNPKNNPSSIVVNPRTLRSKFSQQLISIKLSGNALSDEMVAAFGDSPQLSELEIEGGGNVLNGRVLLSYTSSRITKLGIWGSIEFSSESEFLEFPELKTLILSINQPLTKEDMQWLQKSPKLARLVILKSKIDDLSVVGKLSSVRELEFINSQLSDDAFLRLCRDSQLPRVRHIDITGTGLSARGLSRISDLQSLEILETDVPISVDEVSKLNLPPSLRCFLNRSIKGDKNGLSVLEHAHPNVRFAYQEKVQEYPVNNLNSED